MRRLTLGIGALVLFVVGATVVFGSWYTIDQGTRGVILRNGAIVGTAQPGLGFKVPWIESVVKIPVTQQVLHWDADSKLQAYSLDQQPADIQISVLYHIPVDKVEDVYSEYGGQENLSARLIARKVPQDLKTVFGKYTAVSVIQDRAKFNADVQAAIVDGVHGPVIIDGVQIENIDFSDAYENAVEARMTAQVEVQKLQQQEAQQEVQAKITVINAQAQADARLAQAKAEAQAVQIRGEAEAAAIRARGAALKDNPSLIALTAAEKWNGALPTTMVPGGAMPFLNLATDQPK
jgi:regulator of protease activity HflC (stomatin/prohibitin superfamily)